MEPERWEQTRRCSNNTRKRLILILRLLLRHGADASHRFFHKEALPEDYWLVRSRPGIFPVLLVETFCKYFPEGPGDAFPTSTDSRDFMSQSKILFERDRLENQKFWEASGELNQFLGRARLQVESA